eukprot:scaffold3623_cov136-Skeletonema_menzelii.AAC.10
MVEGCLKKYVSSTFSLATLLATRYMNRGSARKTSIGESLRPPADDVPQVAGGALGPARRRGRRALARLAPYCAT